MNEKTINLMFSSKSDEWETPQDLFDELDKRYNFTLDPCATPENAKCTTYYTPDENGLTKDWGGHTVFINPPYTRGAIAKWIKKAHNEGNKPSTTVVCLIPARTDTKYWHDYCMDAAKIYFIKGRLKFGGGDKNKSGNAAPFPSVLIVFSYDRKKYFGITPASSLDKKGVQI